MSDSVEGLVEFIDALNGLRVAYILTGSLARNMYCLPRSTVDADFVVDINAEVLNQLTKEVERSFRREPQAAFETVTGKVQHKFHHRKTEFLIEVFEANLDDPHEQSRLERRVMGDVEGHGCFVSTAEDLVIQKLRWFARIRREKDWVDVQEIVKEQDHLLDWVYIERWCAEHNTCELLKIVRKRT